VLREASVAGGALFAAFNVFWTSITLLLAAEPFRLGPQAAGLFGIVGVAGALLAPFAGKYADKRGPRSVISAAIGLVVSAFVIFLVSRRSVVGLFVGVLILDVGVQAAQISNQSRIFAVRPDARSRVNTVYIVAYSIGGAIGAAMSSVAWHMCGWIGVCTQAS
jgi:predicted MFS family arabinose efflux permease